MYFKFIYFFYLNRGILWLLSSVCMRLLIIDVDSVVSNIDFDFKNNVDFNLFLDFELENFAKSKGYTKFFVEKGQKYVYIFNAESYDDMRLYKKFVENKLK